MADGPYRHKAAILADLAGCVRFFSVLPVPALGRGDDPAKMPDFSRSAWALPVAGLIIAAPALAVVVALHAVEAPALVAAFIFVGLCVWSCGGLHEDGLADTADGFGGGTTVEKKLAIMKDSRIGAYGVLALILVVGLKGAAIAHLFAATTTPGFAAMLIVAVAASRLAMLFLWHGLRNARTDGLSVAAGRPSRRALEIAGGIVLILAIALAPALTFPGFAGAGAALVLSTALAGRLAMRHIGGQTGDVLGACQQIAEAAILTALSLTAI